MTGTISILVMSGAAEHEELRRIIDLRDPVQGVGLKVTLREVEFGRGEVEGSFGGQASGLHLDIQVLAGQLERLDVIPETIADVSRNPLHIVGQVGAACVPEPLPLVIHNQLFAQGSHAAAFFLQFAVVDVSSGACPGAGRRSVGELQLAAPCELDLCGMIWLRREGSASSRRWISVAKVAW